MEKLQEHVIRYIRGDRHLASDSEHERTYYHYVGDELGSVTHVTDKNGIVLNRYAYDAFGNRTVCEEKIANRFGYAGEMYDGVTQQYYLRARFYNPIIGRFTQEDTYYGDGLNLYEYGRNNPVRYIDPSGHEVRAAAEKNYVNRAVDAMNGTADQGVNGMLERVYGGTDGSSSSVQHAVGNANQAQSVLDGINPKYFNSDSRFGGGFYVGADSETIVAELAEHGNIAKYAISYDMNLNGKKVLDLTNPQVSIDWGYVQNLTSTKACQKIGNLALEKGYSVVKFQSYRGDGINYVIYNDFNNILSPRNVIPIN